MDYNVICYKKSCISQVIMRIDFLEYINNNILFNNNVEKEILINFPRKGMQQIIRFQTMNFTVHPEGARTENVSQEGIQQEFVSSLGNKIILSNKFIVLEVNDYSNYENAINVFIPVLRTIMSEIQLTAMRTGIRYINEFGANGIKPQKNYFNFPAAAFIDNRVQNNEKVQPIRSMALSEFLVEDMRLNYRYGQYNPRYPQPIKGTSFVLDYDCFCEEPLRGLESMLDHLNKGHDAIQVLFEQSISEKLRKVMNNG